MDFFDAFFASGMRFTTPILLAALGGLLTAWTRDLNVGLEGAMIFGAFFGVAIGSATGAWLPAVILTLLMGAFFGLVFGFIVAVLKVNVRGRNCSQRTRCRRDGLSPAFSLRSKGNIEQRHGGIHPEN